jgi:hypothetical protein
VSRVAANVFPLTKVVGMCARPSLPSGNGNDFAEPPTKRSLIE